MSEYILRFTQNRIDTKVLRDLTERDLKELGIPLGDRRKILRAIAEIDANPIAARAGAERRQITVLFCDLVGSIALSTQLDPEDLRETISVYHRCCTEVIVSSGGFVAKYLGDGVLAYFGYPQAHENDAERAVHAGLALVAAMANLDTGTRTSLRVRVGIATGVVVVGDLIGEGAAREQAVIGETPNLAARLQTLAEPGKVVIAGTTRRLLGELFEYRSLGRTSIKGFNDPIEVWEVLGPSTLDSRFEALRTANTPLVGRNEQIKFLMSRWRQAANGNGNVVLISGEPGIGKSRIVQDLLNRLGDEAHTRLRYFCSPFQQDNALFPTITQLERAARLERNNSANQRLDKLESMLARATDHPDEVTPLLAELLSMPTGDHYPPVNLSPQKRKQKTLQVLVAQVESLAARQPVLIIYEDVQWIDPSSLELIDLYVERVPTLPILLIIIYRPEFTPHWIGGSHVKLVNLDRLTPEAQAEMINQVAGGKALPKQVTDEIIARTDGIPLFLEELTKAVIESGMLADEGDRYVIKGGAPPPGIPTTLHASLMARLDRLSSVREVAQIAATLGRQFSHELSGRSRSWRSPNWMTPWRSWSALS